MKKVFITIGILLLSCTTKRDVIYSSRKIHKSIDNLETMRKWIYHDVKEGTNLDHYNLLIDQTIYNLERHVTPRRSYNDFSGNIYYLSDVAELLQLQLDAAYQIGHLESLYYEELTKTVLKLNSTLNKMK